MKKTFGRLAAVAVFSTLISAPAMADSITYQVEPSHTFARFSYTHMGLSQQISRFDTTTGQVVLDLDAKTGEVAIEIDTRSVSTGHEGFDGHIQGEDFLDTANYPTSTFKSSKIVFDGDKPTAVEGELTIKGVTKPVTLTVTHFVTKDHPMLKKPALGVDAEVQIKRSDFNAGKFAPAVGDEVTISIAFEGIAN